MFQTVVVENIKTFCRLWVNVEK